MRRVRVGERDLCLLPWALALLALAAWLLSQVCAGAQTVAVLGGVGVSGGLGEINPSPEAIVLVDATAGALVVETTSTFDAARKYTGHGWTAKQAVEVLQIGGRPWGLLVGAEYCYRDGGPWVKQGVWLRAGIAWQSDVDTIKVVVRVPAWDSANDTTHSRIGQIEIRHRMGQWLWSAEYGGVVFTQPGTRFGFYTAFRVGRTFAH